MSRRVAAIARIGAEGPVSRGSKVVPRIPRGRVRGVSGNSREGFRAQLACLTTDELLAVVDEVISEAAARKRSVSRWLRAS